MFGPNPQLVWPNMNKHVCENEKKKTGRHSVKALNDVMVAGQNRTILTKTDKKKTNDRFHDALMRLRKMYTFSVRE